MTVARQCNAAAHFKVDRQVEEALFLASGKIKRSLRHIQEIIFLCGDDAAVVHLIHSTAVQYINKSVPGPCFDIFIADPLRIRIKTVGKHYIFNKKAVFVHIKAPIPRCYSGKCKKYSGEQSIFFFYLFYYSTKTGKSKDNNFAFW